MTEILNLNTQILPERKPGNRTELSVVVLEMVALGPEKTGTDGTCQVPDQRRELGAAEPVVLLVDRPRLTNLHHQPPHQPHQRLGLDLAVHVSPTCEIDDMSVIKNKQR